MPNGDIVYVFEKLGLSEYESKALSALLARHDATGMQIADASEIPITKVYSVLNSLEKRGLVKCTLERPKKYRPIDPESITSVLIGKKKEEIELMEKTAGKSLKELKGIYEQGEKFEGNEKIIFLPNFEVVWFNVMEMVKNAKKSLDTSCDRWIYQYAWKNDKTMIAGINACNRGVRYRCIVPASISEIFKKFELSKNALLWFSHKNVAIRIIDDSRIYHNIMIGDEKALGMSFKDIKTGDIVSGIAIYDESVTKGALDYFNMLWNSAIPTENDIRKEAQRILEKVERSKVSVKAR